MSAKPYFWEVRVDAWQAQPKKPNRCVRRWFLVEAGDSDAAMSAAVAQAQATAPMGLKWIWFEAMFAATVKLPYECDRKVARDPA